MSPQTWIAGAVGCAAIVDDLAHRRISNWIPVMALLSGFAFHGIETGWRGTLSAAAGASTGCAAFLLFYLLGGLGGGDIKLMSGFGAILGAKQVLTAALIAAAAGSLIALGAIAWAGLRGRRVESIPYAPAIAVGALAMLLSRLPGGH